MARVAQKVYQSYFTEVEQRKLCLYTRGFFGNHDSFFPSNVNFFKFDPNYNKLLLDYPQFKDASERWVNDRLETIYFYENEKKDKIEEKIIIGGISKIPANVSSETFWLEFIEKNNLNQKFLYEKKEFSLYFYIILNKIKFIRGAIKSQSSEETYHDYLINYAIFLTLIQDIGSNWQYYTGYNEFYDDTSVGSGTDHIRKLPINYLDVDHNMTLVMRFFYKIISNSAVQEHEITMERLTKVFDKCGKNKIFDLVKLLCFYLRIDKSPVFTNFINDYVLSLWEKYTEAKPLLLLGNSFILLTKQCKN